MFLLEEVDHPSRRARPTSFLFSIFIFQRNISSNRMGKKFINSFANTAKKSKCSSSFSKFLDLPLLLLKSFREPALPLFYTSHSLKNKKQASYQAHTLSQLLRMLLSSMSPFHATILYSFSTFFLYYGLVKS